MSEIVSPILFDAAVAYANETADASIRGDLRIAFVAGAEWQWKRDADLSAENARLRTERYQLAYAICGGEDAPGYLDSIDVETIAKVCRDNYRDWSSQTDKNIRLEADNAKLRAALIEASTRMKNARGAVESNQVIDKDVHGTLTRGMFEIAEALGE